MVCDFGCFLADTDYGRRRDREGHDDRLRACHRPGEGTTRRGGGVGSSVKGEVVVMPFPFADPRAANRQPSKILPNRLFTAESSVIICRAGALRPGKMGQVAKTLVTLLTP